MPPEKKLAPRQPDVPGKPDTQRNPAPSPTSAPVVS
jgi:hypothetical protein